MEEVPPVNAFSYENQSTPFPARASENPVPKSVAETAFSASGLNHPCRSFFRYFFAPGIMLLNRAMRPGLAAVAAEGFAGTAAGAVAAV